MLTRERAFKGPSRADTVSAILDRDPAPMERPGEPRDGGAGPANVQ
jgi:hypothetical protein